MLHQRYWRMWSLSSSRHSRGSFENAEQAIVEVSGSQSRKKLRTSEREAETKQKKKKKKPEKFGWNY
jgi:hypothetical protein